MVTKSKKFIQKAHLKKHALHKQLGYPITADLPTGLLKTIKQTPIGNKVTVKGESRRVTPLLKKRVNLAVTLERL